MSASEALVQQQLLIRASELNWRLFRNNVGCAIDARGVPIRYGLCNASKAQNQQFKSGDLIGIRPVLITQAHVGTVVGQFVSVEAKREGWRPRDNDQHEQAQRRWAELVTELGGFAVMTNDVEGLK